MAEQEKVKVKAQCSACGGTGICVRANCHVGVGVICDNCEGNGWVSITYTPFVEKKRRTDIKRVFEAREHLLSLYSTDHMFKNGTTVKYSEFGCTYEEWENGETPKPWPEDTPPV